VSSLLIVEDHSWRSDQLELAVASALDVRVGTWPLEVHVAGTAGEAVDLLEVSSPDLVFLDYDLDLDGSLSTEVSGTGEDVASAISTTPATRRPAVLVHSKNPEKGPRLVAGLAAAGIQSAWIPVPRPEEPGYRSQLRFLGVLAAAFLSSEVGEE